MRFAMPWMVGEGHGGECSGWAVARRGGSGLNARGGHTTRKDDAEYDVGARFLPFDGNNAHEATPSESVASCALHKVGWGKGVGGEGERKRGWVHGRMVSKQEPS